MFNEVLYCQNCNEVFTKKWSLAKCPITKCNTQLVSIPQELTEIVKTFTSKGYLVQSGVYTPTQLECEIRFKVRSSDKSSHPLMNVLKPLISNGGFDYCEEIHNHRGTEWIVPTLNLSRFNISHQDHIRFHQEMLELEKFSREIPSWDEYDILCEENKERVQNEAKNKPVKAIEKLIDSYYDQLAELAKEDKDTAWKQWNSMDTWQQVLKDTLKPVPKEGKATNNITCTKNISIAELDKKCNSKSTSIDVDVDDEFDF